MWTYFIYAPQLQRYVWTDERRSCDYPCATLRAGNWQPFDTKYDEKRNISGIIPTSSTE